MVKKIIMLLILLVMGFGSLNCRKQEEPLTMEELQIAADKWAEKESEN